MKTNRRDFLKKVSLGGLGLGFMFDHDPAKEIEYITQKVNRAGKPSDLKITDGMYPVYLYPVIANRRIIYQFIPIMVPVG